MPAWFLLSYVAAMLGSVFFQWWPVLGFLSGLFFGVYCTVEQIYTNRTGEGSIDEVLCFEKIWEIYTKKPD